MQFFEETMQQKTIDEYLEELQWPPSLEKKLKEFAEDSPTLDFSDFSEFIRRFDYDELGRFYRNISVEWGGVVRWNHPGFSWGEISKYLHNKHGCLSLNFEPVYDGDYTTDILRPSFKTKYVLSLYKEEDKKGMLTMMSSFDGEQNWATVRLYGTYLPLRLSVEIIRENPSDLPWLLSEVTNEDLDHFFPEPGKMNIYIVPGCFIPDRVDFEPIDIKIRNSEWELGINVFSEEQIKSLEWDPFYNMLKKLEKKFGKSKKIEYIRRILTT